MGASARTSRTGRPTPPCAAPTAWRPSPSTVRPSCWRTSAPAARPRRARRRPPRRLRQRRRQPRRPPRRRQRRRRQQPSSELAGRGVPDDSLGSRVMGGRGYFIAFEGGEGVGKSSQVRLLAERLVGAGHQVLTTREPGGTSAGLAIRSIVLEPSTGHLSPRAEALLYAADRAHHVATVVRPALDSGTVVITDRYVDSSLAYQGAGRTLDLDQVRRLSDWATEGLLPDLTILLDLDPEVGLARAGDPDRLEAEPLDFHGRVRALFLKLATEDRYVVVDASGPVGAVHEAVVDAVFGRLPEPVTGAG